MALCATAATAATALFIISFARPTPAAAQVSVTTYHNDNSRTGQNTSETLLTPTNVNSNTFGKLAVGSVNLDSWATGQPLYMANVTIAGVKHNVVYVATINNSVYAFDADTGVLIWSNNYGVPTPYAPLCQDSQYAGAPSGGAGIVGTPVIDPVARIMYFVAKTGNGSSSPFAVDLHAVDITTGLDEAGSPVVVTPPGGPSFLPEYQMSRPAMLLNNGTVYVSLGSTGCVWLTGFPQINNHGYVLGYNTANLAATPTWFVTTTAVNNGGIWQSGGGPATDANGDVYFETANAPFDYNTGGQDFGDSVIKLAPTLGLADYFTPFDQANLNALDLDLASSAPMLLPDQSVGPTHLMVATGKAEEVYLINRDSMGEYCSGCSSNTNIVQDIPRPPALTGCVTVNGTKTCSYGPISYWNNNIYIPSAIAPLMEYSLINSGTAVTLSTLPTSQTTGVFSGEGSPSISANGNSNAIAWSITWGTGSWTQYTGTLHAFDATNLATEFYNSDQAANSRDTLGLISKFITPAIANGKVYTASQTQLQVYGLLFSLRPNGGNKQTAAIETTLPLPLTVQAVNPYTGKPAVGVPVSFSDSGAGGTFGTPSAVTDSNGNAATTYTLPKKTGMVNITVSGATSTSIILSATGISGSVANLALVSGGGQSGTVTATLTQPIVVAAKDQFGNLISGASINFTDGGAGGMFSINPVLTASNGRATVTYTLPTKAVSLTLNAAAGSASLNISEKSLAGPAWSVSYVSGNKQTAPPQTMLTNPLIVAVKDQYNNLVTGASVSFSDSGAGGKFSPNAVAITGSNGRATVTYTTGPQAGTVNVSGTITTLPPALFVETVN